MNSCCCHRFFSNIKLDIIMFVSLFLLIVLLHDIVGVSSFQIHPATRKSAITTAARKPIAGTRTTTANRRIQLYSSGGGGDDQQQASEAIKSLMQYHEGKWTGQARSFTVNADTAAGIMKRKTSPQYEITVKLGLDSSSKKKKKEFALQETFSWEQQQQKQQDSSSSDDNNDETTTMSSSSRSISINDCNMDVDSVDASYSLDDTLPDFPSKIIGTNQICQFMIEHCLAASETRRLRCFIMYGVDQSLQRVVVCDETKVIEQQQQPSNNSNNGVFTAADLLEMQNDVDRLVDKITGGNGANGDNNKGGDSSSLISSTPPSKNINVDFPNTGSSTSTSSSVLSSNDDDDGTQQLTLHDVSLLELSSGVWLGDAIIRDYPNIKISPKERQRGRGFGSSSGSSSSSSSSSSASSSSTSSSRQQSKFGDWSVGVQKIASRWMWNFGDEIRQSVDIGKAMGAQLTSCLTGSLAGSVCVNEGLSRRIPKKDRMVYIDFPSNDMVGFMVGAVALTVPRYINFNPNGQNKPFFTEFSVYQKPDFGDDDGGGGGGAVANGEVEAGLPELFVSKISRVYNYEGRMKQGCTSFYTFKRFGSDGEIEE